MKTLPRSRIVKKNKEIQQIYRNGKTYVTRYFVVYVFPSEETPIRAAFAAGKKLGNAVIRNRVKRRLREVFRLHQSNLEDAGLLLIVGRKPILDARFAEIEKAFLAVCRKIKKDKKAETI